MTAAELVGLFAGLNNMIIEVQKLASMVEGKDITREELLAKIDDALAEVDENINNNDGD